MSAFKANSIRPAIAELERLFDVFSVLFDCDLPLPVITIQTHGRKKTTLGWFWSDAWLAGESTVPEINFAAELLNRDVYQICETLIHEMVHYRNAAKGIKDCNSNQYHNKKFKTACDLVGLNCEKIDGAGRGWAWTSLSAELEAKIKKAKPKKEVFEMCRRSVEGKKAPTKMKKWVCECGTIVRCAVDLNATCDDCETKFQIEE